MRTSRLCVAGAAAIAMVAAAGAATSSGASAPRLLGPFLLVTLPSLGTVTWTCDVPGYPSFALGYRASPRHATTTLELRAGTRVVARRRVQPGQRVRFPFLRTRRQTLALIQGTGAGTLTASVAVDFVPGLPVTYCRPYAPPAIRVHVSPRQ